jgi:hypothetical protein
MIRLPVSRPFTGPRPPEDFAARLFAAVILPPLLFFAMFKSLLSLLYNNRFCQQRKMKDVCGPSGPLGV